MTPKHYFEFGEFRVDLLTHRLLRNGEVVALQPKAFDTLVVLIQNRGRVVERPVLMGHQKCGAVTAAAESGEAEGHLPSLLGLIRPAIERAKGQPGDLIDNAVRINVENVVRQIRGSAPVLAPLVDRGALKVVGAVYSLDTGKVAWLPESQINMRAQVGRPNESIQCIRSQESRDFTDLIDRSTSVRQ